MAGWAGGLEAMDNCTIDNCPMDNCVLGQRSPWSTVPWTNVIFIAASNNIHSCRQQSSLLPAAIFIAAGSECLEMVHIFHINE